jgi:hypothetical protein
VPHHSHLETHIVSQTGGYLRMTWHTFQLVANEATKSRYSLSKSVQKQFTQETRNVCAVAQSDDYLHVSSCYTYLELTVTQPQATRAVTTYTCTLPSVHYTCRTSRSSTNGTYNGTAKFWWTGACCTPGHSTSGRSRRYLWEQHQRVSKKFDIYSSYQSCI